MDPPSTAIDAAAARGRLRARPVRGAKGEASAGEVPLRLGGRRDGALHVPPGIARGEPRPLLLYFHGGGGDAREAALVLDEAAAHRVLVLALDSRERTWDVIAGGLGPDVTFVDRALAWTFERHAVDASRVAVSGFSDGASYALTLGRANGDLFSAIVAFSPGFDRTPEATGTPRIFVSHGIGDLILRIAACSRQIVPRLIDSGHQVEFCEFDGGHAVPEEIVRRAFAWLAA